MKNMELTEIVRLFNNQQATRVLCVRTDCKHKNHGCAFKEIVIDENGRCSEFDPQDKLRK